MVSVLGRALDIVASTEGATLPAAAGQILFGALKSYGVRGFGLRAYDTHSGSSSMEAAPGTIFSNLPDHWTGSPAAALIERLDPLPKAARRFARPSFLWSEASPKSERKWRAYWEGFAEHGIADGLAVHFFAPNGVTSRISMGFAIMPPPPDLKAIELASYAVLDKVMRLGQRGQVQRPAQLLSPRERDCLSFAAQGLTDAGIARKLGLTESTAHSYVESAKRKLGVRTRAQAIAHLIGAGLL